MQLVFKGALQMSRFTLLSLYFHLSRAAPSGCQPSDQAKQLGLQVSLWAAVIRILLPSAKGRWCSAAGELWLVGLKILCLFYHTTEC